MTPPRAALALTFALIAGSALAAEDSATVKVDAATQKRIGVVTAPLAVARRSATLSGFARVLDPTPLATLDADIAAAAAAASASAAEAARAKALNAADATLSTKAAQSADAQARVDQSRLKLLRLRLGLEWGPAFVRMSDAARAQLLTAIAAGQASLLRIDLSTPPPAEVRGVDVDLGGGATARAIVLGPARTGDPRLQSTGLIAKVSGPSALRLGAGLTFPVRVAADAGTIGVILPRAALLRTGGETVVYVRKDAGSFEKRVARNGVSQADGLFVPGGFRAGEQVAVQGAQALYAAQNPPAAEAD